MLIHKNMLFDGKLFLLGFLLVFGLCHIAAGLALAGGAVAVGSGSGGGGGSTTAGGTVPSSAEISGTYTLTGTKASDSCGIGSSTISNLNVPIPASNGTGNINNGSATLTGSYNSSTGSYPGAGYSGHFKETFIGTFARNGHIMATGSLMLEQLAGTNVGCSVAYNATYRKN